MAIRLWTFALGAAPGKAPQRTPTTSCATRPILWAVAKSVVSEAGERPVEILHPYGFVLFPCSLTVPVSHSGCAATSGVANLLVFTERRPDCSRLAFTHSMPHSNIAFCPKWCEIPPTRLETWGARKACLEANDDLHSCTACDLLKTGPIV